MPRILVVFLVLCTAAAGGWWYWTTTPQYAVQQASNAIKAHDLTDFRRWVDAHQVASATVEDLLAEPVRNSGGAGIIERVIGLTVFSVLKPTVAGMMESQIDKWISTPPKSANGAPLEDNVAAPAEQPKGLLGQIVALVKPPSLRETFREFGFTKKNYQGLGKVDTSDNVSHVGLRFYSPKLNNEIEVQVELVKGSSSWQIVRISNLQDIVRKLAVN